MSNPVTLRALLGDRPVTHALRRGDVRSAAVQLDFADVRSPAAAFKRVVRDLEFDVAELAIVVTFLLAKAHGPPLVHPAPVHGGRALRRRDPRAGPNVG